MTVDETWRDRLNAMEDWYAGVAADPDAAARSLLSDYSPHIAYLQKLRGSILDVGGGAGLAGAFLQSAASYTVIDPSQIWLDDKWSAIADRLSKSRLTPEFVIGIGEKLPFADASFDAALSMWSLYHATTPAQCLEEMFRVLRKSARALVILEDMAPLWGDVGDRLRQSVGRRLGRQGREAIFWPASLGATVATKLRGSPWPLQADHMRIDDRAFRSWLRGASACLIAIGAAAS